MPSKVNRLKIYYRVIKDIKKIIQNNLEKCLEEISKQLEEEIDWGDINLEMRKNMIRVSGKAVGEEFMNKILDNLKE
jgi:hypothetical protein